MQRYDGPMMGILGIVGMISAWVASPGVGVAAAEVMESEPLHVFLLMGQSNMSGYGKLLPGDEVPIDGVWMTRGWKPGDYRWEPARQPLHNRLGSDQFCLGGAFAKAYRDAHPGVRVGLIPVAWGGAGITHLHQGTAAYDDAIAKARLAAKGGVLTGVLWHQGESDTVAPEDAENYAERLYQLVYDLREDLDQPDLPFIAGNLAEFYGTGPDHREPERVARIDQVRNALRDLPRRLSHTAFVESSGLRAREQHQVHFNRESLIRFGKRYAAAVATLPLDPAPPSSGVGQPDWLLDGSPYRAGVFRGNRSDELVLANGLVRRTFRLGPNAATVGFDNLVTGESVIRGVKPEAQVEIDGVPYDIGGLKGQPNYAFLQPDWIDSLTADPAAFHYTGFEIGVPKKRFEWKRVRHHAPDVAWPPGGVYLRMDYRMPELNAGTLAGGSSVPSDVGRAALITDSFDRLDPAWKTHVSKAHARSSFENEGKVGEIYTPANTCVFVERPLPAEVHLVEATIDAGTDGSSSWGPGIALVWPKRVVKFHLRPGGNAYDSAAMFGLWDGSSENAAAGGRQKLDLSAPWSLRLRLEGAFVYCEAKPAGGVWTTQERVKIDPGMGPPEAVRVGKLSRDGGGTDHQDPGELVRLHVLDFAAYGGVEAAHPADAEEEEFDPGAVRVSVHYELYDGIPCLSKWITVHNDTGEQITVNRFTSEMLAAVEYTSRVEDRGDHFPLPNLMVETDYAFQGMDPETVNRFSVHWMSDPDYSTQVSYLRTTPCLLKVSPEVGPEQDVAPGRHFESFRAFVGPYDSYDRERQGLTRRRMYRTIAPWTTENPLMMHARFADWDRVKLAIDQAAEVGFEMVILTFGSGFNIENESPEYLAQMKRYADYARDKGLELGGYSLLSSRRIGGGNDVVSPPGQRPTHGNCPALTSEWGQDYFRKLYQFYEKTGHMLLEHDGSYPGDIDVTPRPPLQKGEKDSRWVQWRIITDFYKWCRARGIYLNVPDYYYLAGSSKCGMGYREVNWSLPRAQQVIHTRQNIYDGTWSKLPSMGWMFVPLTQYHGGGAAATIEPLDEHRDHYERMLYSNLALGVQACYRGPRLFDTDATKELVTQWVDWFRTYRDILESDLIHGRRADGRNLDWMLHVNPALEHKGMLVVFNPLDHPVEQTLRVPLYYTGLTDTAVVSSQGATGIPMPLARDYSIDLPVEIPAQGMSWYLLAEERSAQ